jgi:hypothetical protein
MANGNGQCDPFVIADCTLSIVAEHRRALASLERAGESLQRTPGVTAAPGRSHGGTPRRCGTSNAAPVAHRRRVAPPRPPTCRRGMAGSLIMCRGSSFAEIWTLSSDPPDLRPRDAELRHRTPASRRNPASRHRTAASGLETGAAGRSPGTATAATRRGMRTRSVTFSYRALGKSCRATHVSPPTSTGWSRGTTASVNRRLRSARHSMRGIPAGRSSQSRALEARYAP